jgi:hypothetical protein
MQPASRRVRIQLPRRTSLLLYPPLQSNFRVEETGLTKSGQAARVASMSFEDATKALDSSGFTSV